MRPPRRPPRRRRPRGPKFVLVLGGWGAGSVPGAVGRVPGADGRGGGPGAGPTRWTFRGHRPRSPAGPVVGRRRSFGDEPTPTRRSRTDVLISEKNAGRATDPRRRAGPARLAQGAHRPPPAPPRPLRRPLRRRRGRPGLAGGGDGGARIVREQHLRSSISSRAEVRVAEGGGGGGGGAPVQLAEGQRRRAEGQPRNQQPHHQHRHQQQQHRQQRRALWAALPVAAGLAAPREPLAAGARRGGAGRPRRVLSAVQVLFCHSPFFAFVH